MKTSAAAALACVPALLVALAAVAIAGPLNPPAGPVTSNYKTLTEVEPRVAISSVNTPGDADSSFKITLPGSYYLTANITGVTGKHGIEIAASGVTIDLNGFDLAGTAGMGGFDGISTTAPNLTNITVRNGSVRGWGDDGVDLRTVGATNCAIINVLSSGNTGDGFLVNAGCAFTGCSAYLNTGNGIVSGGVSTFNGCTAYQNTGIGIVSGAGSTITACTAFFNSIHGISVSADSTISNCSVRGNTQDGIQVVSNCLVLANVCAFNGNGGSGAGINATGADNRIEGNNCTGADRGIDVDFAGNIIIRNSCSGNTVNWDFVANNRYGPIIDISAAGAAAVSGSSAPGTLTSSDPNANFTY